MLMQSLKTRWSRSIQWLAVLMTLGLAACSHSDEDAGPGIAGRTGCVQGIVVDGFTGERIPIPSADYATGINILARGHLLPAAPLDGRIPQTPSPEPTPSGKALGLSDNHDTALQGEYNLCGVPLDETLPIMAHIKGYAPFNSYVHIDSTVAQKAAQAREDLTRLNPTHLANIRLYPAGALAQDLQLFVWHDGQPQEQAIVQLRPLGTNSLDNQHTSGPSSETPEIQAPPAAPYTSPIPGRSSIPDSIHTSRVAPAHVAGTDRDLRNGEYFLQPASARLLPLSGTTGKDGRIVFKGENLVLGGTYEYVVIPPNGGAEKPVHRDQLTVGLLNNGLGLGRQEPYTIHVRLDSTAIALAIKSSSLESQNFNEKGEITFLFNRPIELVPGTADGIFATLEGNLTSAMKPEITGNDKSESAEVVIEGNRLTLRPSFADSRAPTAGHERGIRVIYHNVLIRPASGQGRTVNYPLNQLVQSAGLGNGQASIAFFGGKSVAQPKTIKVESGDQQTDASYRSGGLLSQVITLRVLNELDSPIANYEVTLTVTKGKSHLLQDRSGSSPENAPLKLISDASGHVRFSWKLADKGKHEVTASGPNVSPVIITATGSNY